MDLTLKPSPATPRSVRVEHVMGTVVTIDVRGRIPDPRVIAGGIEWLHHVDATFSTYREDSEVSRDRRGELAVDEASFELRDIVARCEALRLRTGGYFDAFIGTARFDPSALVKGWAVQVMADRMVAAGLTDFCINAGGDVATRGLANGAPWRIGIRHPHDGQVLAAVVHAADGLAVATSGAYERGDHIVDPVSGRAPTGVLSVTVTGPDLGTADAYATAAFAMGSDGAAWTLGLDGYEAMTILANDAVLTTPGFPALSA
jgi:thiamine biosynthesis lipoprotein